ncbi:MAG TPA: pyridoxamine 5'-phosphate oxidase family protein [Candidatus Saccharimonas sp.]|nr:pyridoxamine 5'-phosphate oxidase family protein [Candidatus Saccharimonas sp.]
MDFDPANYKKIVEYINENPLATLGTINDDGTPHGAVVYVCPDDDTDTKMVYFLTKIGTHKYENLLERKKVSLTIVNPKENSTVQASGDAAPINDSHVIDMVMKKITRAHANAVEWLPPIAKLRAGAYTIVGVTVRQARLARFKNKAIGDPRIFTEA